MALLARAGDPDVERARDGWSAREIRVHVLILGARAEANLHYNPPMTFGWNGRRPASLQNYDMDAYTPPIFIRLPHGSDHCAFTGLTRGHLHDLVVPCARNGFQPAVASYLVGTGRRKVRLICVESLQGHLGRLSARAHG
jgi:hypothetical protein